MVLWSHACSNAFLGRTLSFDQCKTELVKANVTRRTREASGRLSLRRVQSRLHTGGGAGQDVDYPPAVTLHAGPSGRHIQAEVAMTAAEIAREHVISPFTVTGNRLSLPSEDRGPPRLKLRRRGRDGPFLPSPCPGGATSALLDSTVWLCERRRNKNWTCSSVRRRSSSCKQKKTLLPPNIVFFVCFFLLFCDHQVAKTLWKSCWKKEREASFASPLITSV